MTGRFLQDRVCGSTGEPAKQPEGDRNRQSDPQGHPATAHQDRRQFLFILRRAKRDDDPDDSQPDEAKGGEYDQHAILRRRRVPGGKPHCNGKLLAVRKLAEGEGFEPPDRLSTDHPISNRAPSTNSATLPPGAASIPHEGRTGNGFYANPYCNSSGRDVGASEPSRFFWWIASISLRARRTPSETRVKNSVPVSISPVGSSWLVVTPPQ